MNIGFPRVNQSIIDMGIEDIDRAVFSKPKLKNKQRPPLYKNLWIPERRLWIETYSEDEYNEKAEKYATN